MPSAARRFAVYAVGLLGGAERKSVEPMAALACRNPRKMDAAHQRLLLCLPNTSVAKMPFALKSLTVMVEPGSLAHVHVESMRRP